MGASEKESLWNWKTGTRQACNFWTVDSHLDTCRSLPKARASEGTSTRAWILAFACHLTSQTLCFLIFHMDSRTAWPWRAFYTLLCSVQTEQGWRKLPFITKQEEFGSVVVFTVAKTDTGVCTSAFPAPSLDTLEQGPPHVKVHSPPHIYSLLSVSHEQIIHREKLLFFPSI